MLEPILVYFLLSRADQGRSVSLRVVDALVLASTLVALHGLYQYFVSGDVIAAEGVRRIRGLYGSPNNLSLLLGRIVPLGVAFVIAGKGWRRWCFGARCATTR